MSVRDDEQVTKVPTGRVKWYDAEKGFGFLSQEDGEDVYVRSSALPAGVDGLKAGQRVEFGVAAGRRGPQALSLTLIDPPPSLSKTRREAERPEHKHSPDELHDQFGEPFKLLIHCKEQHHTPAGKVQSFVYCYCRRVGS